MTICVGNKTVEQMQHYLSEKTVIENHNVTLSCDNFIFEKLNLIQILFIGNLNAIMTRRTKFFFNSN